MSFGACWEKTDQTILECAKGHDFIVVYSLVHEKGKLENGSGLYDGYFYDETDSFSGSYNDLLAHQNLLDIYNVKPDSIRENDGVLEMVLVYDYDEIDYDYDIVRERPLCDFENNIGIEGYNTKIKFFHKNRDFSYIKHITTTIHEFHYEDNNIEKIRREYINNLTEKSVIELKREPENEYDSNAIAVMVVIDSKSIKIGYIESSLAAELAPVLDSGKKLIACIYRDWAENDIYLRVMPDDPSASWWIEMKKREFQEDQIRWNKGEG